MSLTLRPYQPSDAAVITSWLKSEYLMRQWCADRYEHYPVMPEDMNEYYERYIDGQRSRAFTMVDGDDIVGTVKYAFKTLGAMKVSLGVFENNPSAIHCYEASGFHSVLRHDTESYECLGETWNCIEMEQHKEL